MNAADVITRYGDAEIKVMIRHREKHAGEAESSYWMEYPSLASALEALREDLAEGRVEAMVADGEALSPDELQALRLRTGPTSPLTGVRHA